LELLLSNYKEDELWDLQGSFDNPSRQFNP